MLSVDLTVHESPSTTTVLQCSHTMATGSAWAGTASQCARQMKGPRVCFMSLQELRLVGALWMVGREKSDATYAATTCATRPCRPFACVPRFNFLDRFGCDIVPGVNDDPRAHSSFETATQCDFPVVKFGITVTALKFKTRSYECYDVIYTTYSAKDDKAHRRIHIRHGRFVDPYVANMCCNWLLSQQHMVRCTDFAARAYMEASYVPALTATDTFPCSVLVTQLPTSEIGGGGGVFDHAPLLYHMTVNNRPRGMVMFVSRLPMCVVGVTFVVDGSCVGVVGESMRTKPTMGRFHNPYLVFRDIPSHCITHE